MPPSISLDDNGVILHLHTRMNKIGANGSPCLIP